MTGTVSKCSAHVETKMNCIYIFIASASFYFRILVLAWLAHVITFLYLANQAGIL